MTLETADARSLWYAVHTGEIDEDPSSDGSGYAPVPCEEIGEIEDQLMQLKTSQQDGTMHGATAPEVGPDGWKLTIKTMLRGLPTAAAVGSAPVAGGHMEAFLANMLKDAITEVARQVGSGSDENTLVLAASVGGLQSLMPIYETAKPDSAARQRMQWALVTDAGSAPSYSVRPDFDDPPTTSGVRRASRTFVAPLPGDSAGALIAFVHRVGSTYTTLLGGRLSAVKWTIPARKLAMAEWTFVGDSQIVETKGSLPTFVKSTVPGIVGVKSPVWFNSSKLPTVDVEIDWGLKTSDDESTAGVNGRAGIDVTSLSPKITLTPTYSDALRALRRAITTGPMLIQIGAGVYDGTRCNAIGVHFHEAFLSKSDGKNVSGRHRAGVTVEVSRGALIGGVEPRFAQVALV